MRPVALAFKASISGGVAGRAPRFALAKRLYLSGCWEVKSAFVLFLHPQGLTFLYVSSGALDVRMPLELTEATDDGEWTWR